MEAGCFENTLDLQDYNVTLFGGTFARITSEDAAYPRGGSGLPTLPISRRTAS